MRIAVNCDLGEGYGRWNITDDEQLLQCIDAANIACGFHAGDPPRMAAAVAAAATRGVGIGAHPSYPDRQGFGRRQMAMAPDELRDFITYQIGALQAFAKAHGTRVEHVKPHGALYNFAAVNEEAAGAVVEGTLQADSELVLVALSGSLLEKAGHARGLRVAREAFIDRAYAADGTLLTRDEPGAVLTDPLAIKAQLLNIVTKQRVQAANGEWIPLRADTVCIHGDTPDAVAIAQHVRAVLTDSGVRRATIGQMLAGGEQKTAG